MKILRLSSDEKGTCAQIVYDGQHFDAVYKADGSIEYQKSEGASESGANPPEYGTLAAKNLLNLLAGMDALVNGNGEDVVINSVLRFCPPEEVYDADGPIENEWRPER